MKTKKFVVTIEEMVSQEFEILAKDDEEAMQIAEEKYKNGEFVLSPGNLVCKQMSVRDTETDSECEWVEF
jgi:hypothetical protein